MQIIHRAIATFLFTQTGQKRDQAATGAVTLIQRFGSAANLNIHLHALVLDGVYGNLDAADIAGTPDESPPSPAALAPIAPITPIFHPAIAPTHAALQALLGKIITRILRRLTRLGHLVEEDGQTYLACGVIDPDDVMTPLQAAAAHYRIAQGPRAGQKVLSLQLAPRHPGSRESSALCANAHGFSLHAGVRCAADDRQGLEQLCRYITRPAISNERLSVNRAGQVVLKLETAWRDGTSHHVMEPMEFMQRLAALVPRPRLHLIRFHGVLAPNAKLRKAMLPVPPPPETKPAHAGDCDHRRVGSVKGRMRWAQLLKRVFDIDIERCPHCGGQLKLIAAIGDAAAIARILTHLGLAAQPPPRAPARRVDLFQAA